MALLANRPIPATAAGILSGNMDIIYMTYRSGPAIESETGRRSLSDLSDLALAGLVHAALMAQAEEGTYVEPMIVGAPTLIDGQFDLVAAARMIKASLGS